MGVRYDSQNKAWLFEGADGWRVLRNPDGPPTARQLAALARAGLLALRDMPGPPLSKLDATKALDAAREAGVWEPTPRERKRRTEKKQRPPRPSNRERVQKLRREQPGLTQREAAEALGVSLRTVKKYWRPEATR